MTSQDHVFRPIVIKRCIYEDSLALIGSWVNDVSLTLLGSCVNNLALTLLGSFVNNDALTLIEFVSVMLH